MKVWVAYVGDDSIGVFSSMEKACAAADAESEEVGLNSSIEEFDVDDDDGDGGTVIDEIRAERARQDEKWGGPEHDDLHIEDEWAILIGSRACDVIADNDVARRRWLEIAALAVAAIESYDRKNRRAAPEENEKS